ncbi:flagellar biosynthesis anti-sigma factor FlgM [Acidocella aromatica]|uniref:Negative regulator of flagellin synthesis n=1 Tax=Acidocella aromatica TaxID=1303579 RepID=A0A840VU82_9PROT|nr:flagellar biosynthesis anti-sigma factor FlgM [Acidocella aromatica]MBB5373762.1 flagellar biosynthesis anti-sigma factor FlgM [Acidocella aromatica]
MTNTIPSLPTVSSSAVMNDSSTAPTSTKPNAAAETAPQTEAVTLSDAAQTTTKLLSAAQQSNGVDQTTVARIRNALASGSYNVAPEDLAQAMATVLKATGK